MSKFLLLGFVMFALGACKTVETPNGEVPAEYVSLSQQVVGTYVNGYGESMTVRMSGNRPVLAYSHGVSKDFIDIQCQSQIGLLREISVNDSKITSAVFSFHPGYCVDVQGQTLDVSLREASGGGIEMTAAVLLSYEDHAQPPCSHIGYPNYPPYDHCVTEPSQPVYLAKKFVKK